MNCRTNVLFTWLIDQHKIKNVAIKVMDNTAGQFYVVTDGLKAGDKIVLESSGNLQDGTEIKPNEVSAGSVYNGVK
jgi:membrane fusion protein (multidrug efflux system)